MWWLALGLAWAQIPAEVDLEDLDRWEEASDRLLDGPRGCWEVVGRATWDWDGGRLGANRGSSVFVGRMQDGVWGEVYVRSLGETSRERGKGARGIRQYVDDVRFIPLVGTIDGRTLRVTRRSTSSNAEVDDPSAEPSHTNVVRQVLDGLSGSVDASWAQWDDARHGVVLHRALPLGDGRGAKEAQVEVFFPGGSDQPDALTVRFPDRFFRGVLPRVRIEDARVDVRGRVNGDSVLPTMESFRFTLGALGYSVTGAQTITYKSAVPCSEAEEKLAVPVETTEVEEETERQERKRKRKGRRS